MTADNGARTFESMLAQLQETVQRLETEHLTLEEAIARGDTEPLTLRVLGEAYLRLGRTEQAAAQFRESMLARRRVR